MKISLSEAYYRIVKGATPPVSEVVERWMRGDKLYDERVHGYYPLRDLWPLREYTWTRSTSRAGVLDGEDLPGPEKWDRLVASMRRSGWDPNQPAQIQVGKDGKAKVAEGNHRLAVAREAGIREVPVVFIFRQSVTDGHQVVKASQRTAPSPPKRKPASRPQRRQTNPSAKPAGSGSQSSEDLANEIMSMMGW